MRFPVMPIVWLVFIVILLALAFALIPHLAAQVPAAPAPHLDRVEWALLGADAGSRALDTYSTRLSLSEGNRELILPGFVANHAPVLAAYGGGVVALNWWGVRELERHHHARLAHALPVIDITNDLPFAIHNLTLGRAARGFDAPRFNPVGPGLPVGR